MCSVCVFLVFHTVIHINHTVFGLLVHLSCYFLAHHLIFNLFGKLGGNLHNTKKISNFLTDFHSLNFFNYIYNHTTTMAWELKVVMIVTNLQNMNTLMVYNKNSSEFV